MNERSSQISNYLWALVAYTSLLSVFLLAPLDFGIFFHLEESNLRWLTETNGVEFSSVGSLRSSSPPRGLYEALVSGNGLTLEVWAAPENVKQKGPARIVSYSNNPSFRNFTLGQERGHLIMRLRTTETDLNGTNPDLIIKDIFHPDALGHIVVIYDFAGESVYVDGKMRLRSQVPGGKFSNWDPSYFLVIGNEVTGDRPWPGKLFLGLHP